VYFTASRCPRFLVGRTPSSARVPLDPLFAPKKPAGRPPGPYGTTAVAVFEFPWLLERVTETDVTACALPETVKGCVKVN
jgi:hypothetical protein